MENSLLSAALKWAEGGWAVLPVKVTWNDKQRKWIKQPLIKGGFRSASSERAQIVQWWAQYPTAQIGGVPASAGFIVIDPDVGHDPRHMAGLPPTRIHRTISGGTHWLYGCDEEFGNEPWAPRIDIRSAAGFIVLPPSIGYSILDARDAVEFPLEHRARLRQAQEIERRPITAEREIDPVRLRQLLVRIDPGRFPGYNEWICILAAIANCGGDGQMALEWSSGRLGGWPEPSEYCGDHWDMDAKLASFHRTEGKMASWGTLWHFAYGGDDTPTTPVAQDTVDTAEWWSHLKIPPITQLIGPISTSSRSLLIAPTGAGKTHVAMALAAALASGTDWLHWHVPAPKVVLYIDGEMPKGLMQERVIDALHRLPADAPLGERWVLKSSSFYYIPPLNMEAGQKWVDERIKAVKPDLIIFDNIQALTTGDMKETTSWRSVQPWMRTAITSQDIAQIWVHHANQDGSSYGDKTREYQMDTVIKLMPAEEVDGGGVCVDLSFPKKREHHPGKNDAVYAEGRVTLTNSGWTFEEKRLIEIGLVEKALGAHRTIQPIMTTAELARALATVGDDRRPNTIIKWLRYHSTGRLASFYHEGTDIWQLPESPRFS